jgi:hypothetical protein
MIEATSTTKNLNCIHISLAFCVQTMLVIGTRQRILSYLAILAPKCQYIHWDSIQGPVRAKLPIWHVSKLQYVRIILRTLMSVLVLDHSFNSSHVHISYITGLNCSQVLPRSHDWCRCRNQPAYCLSARRSDRGMCAPASWKLGVALQRRSFLLLDVVSSRKLSGRRDIMLEWECITYNVCLSYVVDQFQFLVLSNSRKTPLVYNWTGRVCIKLRFKLFWQIMMLCSGDGSGLLNRGDNKCI